MNSHYPRIARIAAPLVLVTLCAGCVAVPADPAYTGAVVETAPPPPREEVIVVAPTPGYVWVTGFWGWEGRRHVWHPGHYVAPRPGYHWVPHTWVRVAGGWRMREGHWER